MCGSGSNKVLIRFMHVIKKYDISCMNLRLTYKVVVLNMFTKENETKRLLHDGLNGLRAYESFFKDIRLRKIRKYKSKIKCLKPTKYM